jgi:hypothetical protein
MALRDAARQVKGLRLSMRSMGVKIDGPCKMAVDNMSVVTNTSHADSPLKHLMYGAAYHFIREALCMEIIDVIHVGTNENLVDIFTKGLNGDKVRGLVKKVIVNGSNKNEAGLDPIKPLRGEDIKIKKTVPRFMMVDASLIGRMDEIPQLIQSLMM